MRSKRNKYDGINCADVDDVDKHNNCKDTKCNAYKPCVYNCNTARNAGVYLANLHYFDGRYGAERHKHARELHVVHVAREICDIPTEYDVRSKP